MTEAPVVLVTGASRGIGKAAALKLAEAGFDVAISARTEKEGSAVTEPNSVRGDDPSVAIPGSLETTAKEMMERPKFSVKLSKKELEEDFMDRSEKARCKVLGFRRF